LTSMAVPSKPSAALSIYRRLLCGAALLCLLCLAAGAVFLFLSLRRTESVAQVESVRWEDLESVELLTTDEGPFSPDVFWVLQGSTGGCVIPQGASGERLLLEKLQGLPGFDNAAVIRAMTLTTNSRLLCWRKPVAST